MNRKTTSNGCSLPPPCPAWCPAQEVSNETLVAYPAGVHRAAAVVVDAQPDHSAGAYPARRPDCGRRPSVDRTLAPDASARVTAVDHRPPDLSFVDRDTALLFQRLHADPVRCRTTQHPVHP